MWLYKQVVPWVLGKGEVVCQAKQVEVMEKECVKNDCFDGTVLLSAKSFFPPPPSHLLFHMLTTHCFITSH